MRGKGRNIIVVGTSAGGLETLDELLDNLDVDYCVPIAGMGQLLATLVSGPHGENTLVPADVRTEAAIAERVLSDIAQVNGLGRQVPYNCPGCGGVLWEMDAPRKKRYRCHTGHSYTRAALLASQSEKIEEMLWISLDTLTSVKGLMAEPRRAKSAR